jgi:hypothetical protein
MTILDYISVFAIAGIAIYVIVRLLVGWWNSQSSDEPVADTRSHESVPTIDEPHRS